MLQWACARIGAILVTINPAYRIGELVGFPASLPSVLCIDFFLRRLRLFASLALVTFSSYRKFVHRPI
jgi:hypothetical protein